MTITANLNVFNTNFEQNFLKNASPFQKTGVAFLVESTKIDNTTFSCKTALSNADIKTNRMGGTKWTYHNKRSFASN